MTLTKEQLTALLDALEFECRVPAGIVHLRPYIKYLETELEKYTGKPALSNVLREYGNCLLCKQETYLTRHHLVPKSVRHLISEEKKSTKTVLICRPCHIEIHKSFTNLELGETYFTVERFRGIFD